MEAINHKPVDTSKYQDLTPGQKRAIEEMIITRMETTGESIDQARNHITSYLVNYIKLLSDWLTLVST